MGNRKFDRKPTSKKSSATPIASPLQMRPFAAPPQPSETPQLQPQPEGQKTASYNFADISIFDPHTPPPPSPSWNSSPLLQPKSEAPFVTPPTSVEPKLAIRPNDKYEQEADASSSVPRKIDGEGETLVQRVNENEDKSGEKETGDLSTRSTTSRGGPPNRPLPPIPGSSSTTATTSRGGPPNRPLPPIPGSSSTTATGSQNRPIPRTTRPRSGFTPTGTQKTITNRPPIASRSNNNAINNTNAARQNQAPGNQSPNTLTSDALLEGATRWFNVAEQLAWNLVTGEEINQLRIKLNLKKDEIRDKIETNDPNIFKKLKQGKGALKEYLDKELPDWLSLCIFDALKTSNSKSKITWGEIRTQLKDLYIQNLNKEVEWKTISKSMQIGGDTYTSSFTPLNQEFDSQHFKSYGSTGLSSMSPRLTEDSEKDTEPERNRTTNAWYTEFKAENSDEALFSAFRSGVLDDYGIKDPKKRREANKEKAAQLLTAIAIKYLSKKTNDELENANYKVSIPLVTTALLTPVATDKGADEAGKLDRHIQALKDANNEFKNNRRKINVNHCLQPISVEFNIIAFNYGVNQNAKFGKYTQWRKLNSESLDRLKEAKKEAVRDMEFEQKNLMRYISGAQTKLSLIQKGNINEDPQICSDLIKTYSQQFTKIEKDIKKIEQLWKRIQERGKLGGGDVDYEMPALISNLAFLIGSMVHYNCKSGKDRTGMADVETKFLAYQMEDRAKKGDRQLVPHYTDSLSKEDKKTLKTMVFESGNLEVQKYNTGFAGYKVKTPNLAKRLGEDVLNQARGLAADYTDVKQMYPPNREAK
jgi:phosphatidylinositol-4,5-bisphosphate 4-phosphatase